jgi:hypothetical protein
MNKPSILLQKQWTLARDIQKLIAYGNSLGYEFSYGQALRTPEEAKRNAAKGSGIANSLHLSSLAVDLNLFIDGVYQPSTDAHKLLGEYWESLSTPNFPHHWGGRFKRPDGNHYSIGHWGLK